LDLLLDLDREIFDGSSHPLPSSLPAFSLSLLLLSPPCALSSLVSRLVLFIPASLGSALSSSSGVWGEAAAEIDFGAF